MNDDTRDEETTEFPHLVADEESVAGDAPGGGESMQLDELSREELESELELARAEIERLQDQSLRRQAELVNFRRRATKELAEAGTLGQVRLLQALVPVVDDFERAVHNEIGDAQAYHEGMELILRSLHKVLESAGVERVEPAGEAFDPELHEAIARQETDSVPEGQIVEVYQPGYRLRERLIRPATVVVAYGGPAAESAPTDGADSGDADE